MGDDLVEWCQNRYKWARGIERL